MNRRWVIWPIWAVDAIGQDKQAYFQLKAAGGDQMNRFGHYSFNNAARCFDPFSAMSRLPFP
jgi:hypothetical protein